MIISNSSVSNVALVVSTAFVIKKTMLVLTL